MNLLEILRQMKSVLEEEIIRINALIDREMLLEKEAKKGAPIVFEIIEEEETIGRCV